jgi:hypothetical protein
MDLKRKDKSATNNHSDVLIYLATIAGGCSFTAYSGMYN